MAVHGMVLAPPLAVREARPATPCTSLPPDAAVTRACGGHAGDPSVFPHLAAAAGGTTFLCLAAKQLGAQRGKRGRRSRLARQQADQQASSSPLIGTVAAKKLAKPYEVVVIGGGPAGVGAAMKAALLGRRVLVIDKPKLPPIDTGLDISFGGPTGLWSKALRDTAKTVDIRTLKSMGLADDVIWKQVVSNCIDLATQNATYQVGRLAKYKVDYLQARAELPKPGKVIAVHLDGTKTELCAENVLVATGSKPLRPSNIPFDNIRIFDSDTVNKLAFLPRSVCIVGSGIIAIEYAKIFRRLGAKVTVLVRSNCLQALDRIGLDSEIAKLLLKDLSTDGVEVIEGVEVKEFDVPEPGDASPVKLALKHRAGPGAKPASIQCDVFLAATGRVPNSSFLGEAGCEVDGRGNIQVDNNFETTVPGIYACGDSIGAPALASTGEFQAVLAMDRIFDEDKRGEELPQFPVGMWTIPECSYFGLTTKAAAAKGIPVAEGVAKYADCLRGRVFAPLGILKLVFRKDNGAIIGVHILGTDACEMVHYGMDLVQNNSTIFDLMGTIFTAVTFHELFKAAAFDGNSKLEFGLEWRAIFKEMTVSWDLTGKAVNVDEHKPLFDEIDADGSGELDAEELGAFFEKMGRPMKAGTLANLVRLADSDGNGTIDWEEFVRIYKTVSAMGGKPVEAPKTKVSA